MKKRNEKFSLELSLFAIKETSRSSRDDQIFGYSDTRRYPYTMNMNWENVSISDEVFAVCDKSYLNLINRQTRSIQRNIEFKDDEKSYANITKYVIKDDHWRNLIFFLGLFSFWPFFTNPKKNLCEFIIFMTKYRKKREKKDLRSAKSLTFTGVQCVPFFGTRFFGVNSFKIHNRTALGARLDILEILLTRREHHRRLRKYFLWNRQ